MSNPVRQCSGCYFVCLFVCLFDGVYCYFQQYFSYIVAVSFIGRGNRGTRRKPPTCSVQVTDKLYHILLYASPWSRFELTTSVVIDTDCIGSCKSNYHTITATTAPGFCRNHFKMAFERGGHTRY